MFGNRTFVVSVSFDRTFQNKSNLSSLLCPYLANVKSLTQVQRELYWQVIIWQQNWPGNIKREKLKSLGKSKSKLNRSPVLKYLWVKVTFRDISNCQETSRDPQTEMLVRADREKNRSAGRIWRSQDLWNCLRFKSWLFLKFWTFLPLGSLERLSSLPQTLKPTCVLPMIHW